MKKKINIISIAPLINIKKSEITGPAIIYNYFIQSNDVQTRAIIKTFDISGDKEKRAIGSLSIRRIFFFLQLIPKILITILKKRDSKIYIIIAPTLVGLLRDSIIIIFSKLLRNKIYCHALGNYPFFYFSSTLLVRLIIRNVLSLSDKIIVEDEIIKNKFIFLRNKESKTVVIKNCYPNIKKNNFQDKIYNKKNIKILYMGNMIDSKGYFDVLKVIDKLNYNNEFNVKGNFAGRFYDDEIKGEKLSNKKDTFFNFIKKNNLSEKVQYDDFIFNEKKHEILSNTDFFIFPTNYKFEVQPVSIIEAMSYGIIVISCDHGAISSMIDDEVSGFLVKFNQPDEIVRRIVSLSENKYTEMRKNTYKKFMDNYLSEDYSKKILDLMEG